MPLPSTAHLPAYESLPDSRTVTGMSDTTSPAGSPSDTQERLRRYAQIAVAVARRLHAAPSLLTGPHVGVTVFPGLEVEPHQYPTTQYE